MHIRTHAQRKHTDAQTHLDTQTHTHTPRCADTENTSDTQNRQNRHGNTQTRTQTHREHTQKYTAKHSTPTQTRTGHKHILMKTHIHAQHMHRHMWTHRSRHTWTHAQAAPVALRHCDQTPNKHNSEQGRRIRDPVSGPRPQMADSITLGPNEAGHLDRGHVGGRCSVHGGGQEDPPSGLPGLLHLPAATTQAAHANQDGLARPSPTSPSLSSESSRTDRSVGTLTANP